MIERDTHGIPTVITSRPSGLPKQLLGSGADIYELAGMRSEAGLKLVRRYFEFRKKPQLASVIEDQLVSDSSGFATNPFLLTLRCALAEDEDYRSLIANELLRPEIYDRCIRLLLEDNRVNLEPGVISRLSPLAEARLFNSGYRPFYTFSGTDLESAVRSKRDAASLVRSRLLQSIDDPLSDSFRLHGVFAFTHASFAEYLAARKISEQSSHPSQETVGLDVAREEVIRFLMEMPGAGADAAREGFRKRFREPDRYRHVFIRLARLLVDTNVDEPIVLEELWKLACNPHTWLEMLRDAVLLLYKLDGDWFIKRCIDYPDEPLEEARQWIVMYFDHRRLPWSQLEQLVAPGKPWENYVYLAKRPEDASKDDQSFDELLRKFHETPTRELAIVLGQIRNEAAITVLAEKFYCADPEIAEQSVYAVATIKGNHANDYLVDGLLNPPESVGTAPFLNSLRWYGMKALTPEGKQRVMRRIATLPPTDPHLIDLLKTVAGLPVRSGAKLLASLLKLESVSDEAARQGFSEQRALVAEILGHCENPHVVRELLTTAMDEPDPVVRSGIFGIAYGSGIPDDTYDVVLQAVAQENDFATRVAALSALVTHARNSSKNDFQRISEFLLHELQNVSLETDLAWLAQILSSADVVGKQAVPLLERHLRMLRTEARTVKDDADTAGIDIDDPAVDIRADDECVVDRWQAFEVACTSVAGALGNIASQSLDADEDTDAAIALQSVVAEMVARQHQSDGEVHLLQSCLEALVTVSPGDVLFFVDDSNEAEKALREWSAKTDHLVIGSNVFDPYGNLIATRSDAIAYAAPFRNYWDYATSIKDKKQLVAEIIAFCEVEDMIREALGSHRKVESLSVAVSFSAAIRNQNREEKSLQRELAVLYYLAGHQNFLRQAVDSVANNGAIPQELHALFSQREIANALGAKRNDVQNSAVMKAIAVAFRLGKHASDAKSLAGKFAAEDRDADTARMVRIFENKNLFDALGIAKLTQLFELAKSQNWGADKLRSHLSKQLPELELHAD